MWGSLSSSIISALWDSGWGRWRTHILASLFLHIGVVSSLLDSGFSLLNKTKIIVFNLPKKKAVSTSLLHQVGAGKS